MSLIPYKGLQIVSPTTGAGGGALTSNFKSIADFMSTGGTPGGSASQLQYNNSGSFGGTSGLTWSSTSQTMSLAGASIASSNPLLNLSQTWNGSGAFTAILLNITNTASASSSLLLDLQIGGVSKFSISEGGALVSASTGSFAGTVTVSGSLTVNGGSVSLNNGSSNSLSFGTNGASGPSSASGWKIKIYDSGVLSTTTGIGVESTALWFNSAANFKWYNGAGGSPCATLDSTGTFTAKTYNSTPSALTDGASISTNCANGSLFTVTLGGNRTLANPTNAVDGQKIVWRITQDSTGGRTLTLGSSFNILPSIGTVTMSTAANAVNYMTAIYNGSSSKFDVVAFV